MDAATPFGMGPWATVQVATLNAEIEQYFESEFGPEGHDRRLAAARGERRGRRGSVSLRRVWSRLRWFLGGASAGAPHRMAGR